jgi:hypothetical protein
MGSPPAKGLQSSQTPPSFQLYTDRWAFHGPAFQGVSRLLAIGDRHARAVFTVMDTPGGLLDNVAQLIGYWAAVTFESRHVVLPVGSVS